MVSLTNVKWLSSLPGPQGRGTGGTRTVNFPIG
jgi:hypothetical protein